MTHINAAILAPPDMAARVFGQGRREEISRRARLFPEIVPPDKLDAFLPQLAGTEALFSTWGMPVLTDAQLDKLPCLRALFYAAGSPQGFARPLLERGILVSSAWRANGVPVAEFTLAQIILSGKGYFRNTRDYHAMPSAFREAFRGPGCYGETVALLGVGAVGGTLIGLLRPFHLNVVVYDPFLPAEDARALGVEPVSLPEAFARGFVVSNHLADNAQTEGLINGPLLRSLRPDATFINTGRGRTVREGDLADVMTERPDLTALLDVTVAEPMPDTSPLRALPNIRLSTHIAGSLNGEVLRMADSALAEFDRYARGEALQHAVTLEMLARMA